MTSKQYLAFDGLRNRPFRKDNVMDGCVFYLFSVEPFERRFKFLRTLNIGVIIPAKRLRITARFWMLAEGIR